MRLSKYRVDTNIKRYRPHLVQMHKLHRNFFSFFFFFSRCLFFRQSSSFRLRASSTTTEDVDSKRWEERPSTALRAQWMSVCSRRFALVNNILYFHCAVFFPQQAPQSTKWDRRSDGTIVLTYSCVFFPASSCIFDRVAASAAAPMTASTFLVLKAPKRSCKTVRIIFHCSSFARRICFQLTAIFSIHYFVFIWSAECVCECEVRATRRFDGRHLLCISSLWCWIFSLRFFFYWPFGCWLNFMIMIFIES